MNIQPSNQPHFGWIVKEPPFSPNQLPLDQRPSSASDSELAYAVYQGLNQKEGAQVNDNTNCLRQGRALE